MKHKDFVIAANEAISSRLLAKRRDCFVPRNDKKRVAAFCKQVSIILYSLLLLNKANAQKCTYQNLSHKFYFKVSLQKLTHADSISGTARLLITIYPKGISKPIQTVGLKGGILFDTAFKDCNNVRSYITGLKQKAEVLDNDYGDFIVADFNFDGQEDFAVKQDSGGNGGPLYAFFIQRNRLFGKDNYLSEEIQFFPVAINKRQKILTTNVHAGAFGYMHSVYRYNTHTRQWQQIQKSYRKV